jgi:hypothetical protein
MVPLSDEIHGHPHEKWGNPPMYYGNIMGVISFGDEPKILEIGIAHFLRIWMEKMGIFMEHHGDTKKHG